MIQKTDEQLLILFRDNGDQHAFAEFFSRHHRPLVAFLKPHLNGDEHLAEDAAQESFLRLSQHARRIDLSRTPQGWLYTAAINCAIDLQRKLGRRPSVSLQGLLGEDGPGFDPEDPEPCSPLQLLVDAETITRVKAEVSKLPDARRSAIETAYSAQSVTFTEAAAKLDIPAGTLKSRVNASLVELRKRVA